ncbi:hypothetical protein [Bradyrhizobium sp. BR 1433]|uniref:hypothetical protein n=1 Tax=Bradyrhizobium sp. BR 1433 TaxID=3447967 RepID=UPI003EE6BD63
MANKVELYFDDIIALVASGMSVPEILKTNPRFPCLNTWKGFVYNDRFPHRRKRFEWARAQSCRTPRGRSASHFDAIIALVAGGMQIKAACRSRPEFPNWPAFKQFLRKHPDYRQRLNDARPKKVVGEARARVKFAEILSLIEGGRSINSACSMCGVDSPSLYRMMRSDDSGTAQFNAAIAAREAGPSALGAGRFKKRKRRWTEADFQEALEVIRCTTETSVESALQSPLMPKSVVYKWALKTTARSEALRNALDSRPIAAHRRSVAKGPRPVYRQDVLRTGLLANEVYRQASASVPARLDRDFRDDLISEIVIGVLSGELRQEEVKTKGLRSIWRTTRRPFLEVPLNFTPANSDDDDADFTTIDRRSSNEWSLEDAV